MKQTYNITSSCIKYNKEQYNYTFLIRSNIFIANKCINLGSSLYETYYDTLNNKITTKQQAQELFNKENQSSLDFITNNIDWIKTLPKGTFLIRKQKENSYLVFQIRNKKHIKSITKQEHLKVYSKQKELYNFDLNLWVPTQPIEINIGDIVETYNEQELKEILNKYQIKLQPRLLERFFEYWTNKLIVCCSIERRGYTEPSYCTVKDLKKSKSEWINFNQDSRNFNIPIWNEDGGNEMEKWFIKRKLKNIFEL